MKILSVEQTRNADAYTIKHEPISSIDLMERAAAALAQWIVQHYPLPCPVVHIVAATGNNGGDGLCVARLLRNLHYSVEVSIVQLPHASPDFLHNEMLLTKKDNPAAGSCKTINTIDDLSFCPQSLIIDALFGSGLRRPLEGLVAAVVEKINLQNHCCTIIAIDLPSGLYADGTSAEQGRAIVRAHHTISFELPKLAFMLPENHPFVGEWHTVPIGLHKEFIDKQSVFNYYFTHQEALKRQKKSPKFAHKGTHGHVLFVGGSYGKMGAAVMSVKAALKAGAGLVSAYLPRCGYVVMQVAVPEAMVIASPQAAEHHLSATDAMPALSLYQVLALGPGMGMQPQTQALVRELLLAATVQKIPTIIDADALNAIAANSWQHLLPPNAILTPHPKEFERLAGASDNHFQRLEKLRYCARQWHCYIVLKGAHTATACPDGRVFFNSSGNPSMATGGSGDILTGIIAALLAQGYTPEDSALLGVFRHGTAGDRAAARQSHYNSISALDIIDSL